MTPSELKNLAAHLRKLVEKLDNPKPISNEDRAWLIGNLTGLADGLDMRTEGEEGK